jgi:DNA replication protein DnaC
MLCTTLVDDWGPEPLAAEHRRDLLEIVEHRYERGSLLMISQVPVTAGTNSSVTRQSGMPSWTTSFTGRIGSN